MLQTRNVTVTIYEVNGDPVENARVIIELRGMGNGLAGAVAPRRFEQLTNDEGQTVFELWQNEQALSDTVYEISSFHPSGSAIHKRDEFRVYDSDADVKDLINIASVPINPTEALLAQLIAARAATENAMSTSLAILAQVQALYESIGQGGTSPVVQNQIITTVQGIPRILFLGPASNGDGAITYVSSSSNLQVSGNMGIFTSNIPGSHIVLITATNAAGLTGAGTISVTNIASASVTEYTLPGVQVAAVN